MKDVGAFSPLKAQATDEQKGHPSDIFNRRQFAPKPRPVTTDKEKAEEEKGGWKV